MYCGSSIIVPSYQFLMLRYNVSKEVVSLALSVYIIGCAFPMTNGVYMYLTVCTV